MRMASKPLPTSYSLHPGILYGVGVGPGDPELLTLKAVRALKAADVIAAPKSKEESDSIALSIVKGAVNMANKEILELMFPMTKDTTVLRKAREDAATAIADRLKAGKNVACIALGDPMFYSTFSYLIPLVAELLPEVEVKIVQGVSSLNAAAGAALLPLAEADERVAIIPAAYEDERLRDVLWKFDTIVLMKVNKVMDRTLNILDELALKDKAVFVERAGWPEERVVRDLNSLKGKIADYFSLVIVKK